MQQIRADVIAKTLAGDTNAISGLNDRWNNLRKEYVNKHPVLGQYLGDVSDANLTTGVPRPPSRQ